MAGRKRLSIVDLQEVVASLCTRFKIANLHIDQFNALHNFLCGHDVFVNKPTGSGKSIIFQMAPFVEMSLANKLTEGEGSTWKTKAILIVICPLVALMKDQVHQLQQCNISAAYVTSDQSEKILKNIEEGHYSLVYMSPECTLDNDRWRKMLTNTVYTKSLMGIAVDEVHCVTQWGLSNNNGQRTAFRKWYSRLNELRSLTEGIPIMALTATATTETKKKIFSLLEFDKPFEVVASPHRSNISYVVQKMEKGASLVSHFQCIVSEIRVKGKESMRTIIYCQTIFQCSLLYNSISRELGSNLYMDNNLKPKYRIVEMLHSQTPTSVKEHILEQFNERDGHLRLLIATIAYGMGVNCKGVRRVVHFGPSKSLECYIQESGRCGRQGELSYAVLLYNGITLRTADDSMKDYVKGNYSCRREALLKPFDGKSDVLAKPTGHNCCDKCAQSCTCRDGYYCDVDVFLPVVQLDQQDEIEDGTRNVTDNQREQLNRRLLQIHKEIIVAESSRASPHVSYPTTLMHFGEIQVRQVLEHCHEIFTVQDVVRCVEIWNKKHAILILGIIHEVFNDVDQDTNGYDSSDTDSDDDNCTDDSMWKAIATDKSFLSLLNQSEWNVDSFSTDGEADADMEPDETVIPVIVDDLIPSCMDIDEEL